MDWTHLIAIIAGGGGVTAFFKAFAAWERSKGKERRFEPSEPKYKQDFLERLGAMMEAQTKLLTEAHSTGEKMAAFVLATDDQNYPKIWSDHKQQVRTHEAVNNLVELTEEIAKSTVEIQKKVSNA